MPANPPQSRTPRTTRLQDLPIERIYAMILQRSRDYPEFLLRKEINRRDKLADQADRRALHQ